MARRLLPLWLPVALLVVVVARWAVIHGTPPPRQTIPAPEPAVAQPAAAQEVPPSTPSIAPERAEVPPAPGATTTGTAGFGPAQGSPTRYEREDTTGTSLGTAEEDSTWDETTTSETTDETAQDYGTSTTGTGTDYGTTTSYGTVATERAKVESVRAFSLFEGFERGNTWAVESAADQATLELTGEKPSQGGHALKATFKASGKGNFELRREVSLDLSDATTLLADVFNEGGPMALVLGLRGGYDDTLFTSPPKPLKTGWNKDLAFSLKELKANTQSLWGSTWSWASDTVSRISLIFQEQGQAEGVVHVDNVRFDQPAMVIGAAHKPLIKAIKASANAVDLYETLELTVDLEATYQDYFDRTQVALSASFLSPSGKRREAMGFVYGLDEAEARPVWKVRFTPDEAGIWHYDVTVADAGGQVTSETYQLLCRVRPRGHGFVRVSTRDPRYLEFTDGSFYYPIGQNVCWATDFSHFLQRIASYGGNYVRVWLCPWSLQLEVPTQPGKYDLAVAKAVDDLLAECRERGIMVQLVLRYHGMHSESWDKNPYNSANGGPCQWPGDFFTLPNAKDLHKRFLDYVVARWGHSPALMAWELWNEADLTKADRDSDLVDWHREMADYLKKADCHRHLVTTSVSNPARNLALFELPEIDFVPAHFYARDVAERVRDVWLRYRALRKPVFISEFSAGHEPLDDQADTFGAHLHAGLWLAFLTPLAGNAMPWWWDTFVEKNDLYHHWAALVKFAKGVDRRGKHFELVHAKLQLGDAAAVSLQGLVAPQEAYLWVYDDAAVFRPDLARRPVLAPRRPLRLNGMLGGAFTVEFWDARQGKVLARQVVASRDGALSFVLPSSESDIAVKAIWQRPEKTRPRVEW